MAAGGLDDSAGRQTPAVLLFCPGAEGGWLFTGFSAERITQPLSASADGQR